MQDSDSHSPDPLRSLATPGPHPNGPPGEGTGRQRVSPVALLLAIACSISFSVIAHYWKAATTASDAVVRLRSDLDRAHQRIGQLQTQARLADPQLLPTLRDTQYDFVVRNYGFEYEGHTGDLVDEQILMYGLWEKGPGFFMRDYLQNSGEASPVFVDVGCNVGHHSLFLAQYAAEVHGFDPYLPALDRFRHMIERNQITNITVHPVGLGREKTEIPFFAPHEGNFGSGTFNSKIGAGAGREELQLSIVPGDDWFAEHGIRNVTLIKIDIEGYEEAALLGLTKSLAADRPLVFVEVTAGPKGTISSLEHLQTLFPPDYEFIAVLEYVWTTRVDGKYLTAPFGPREAKAFFASDNQGMIAAFPAEKRERVPRRTP